jgi:hypothetical protein
VDSDLAESLSTLKRALEEAGESVSFGRADKHHLERLRDRFALPRRYTEFLEEHDPLELCTRTPGEQVQLIPSVSLDEEQTDFATDIEGKLITAPTKSGWRPSWFIVAHSALLGDPYFLDTAQKDPEGDCPVFTAMNGTDSWQPRLCASTFALFLRILAEGVDVARDFDLDDYDPDNERVFREALAPRIREVDPAAFKAGYWT